MAAKESELKELLELYPTRMSPLPEDLEPGWRIVIEGPDGTLEELKNVSRLSLVNPRFGRVTYGKHPNGGYDACAIHESSGSVIVPFARIGDGFIVGLIKEKRMLQADDGFVWNTVRGYLEPGQSHFETAANEFAEEIGTKPLVERIRLLPGDPGNQDSAMMETWGRMPNGEAEGVRFFSYEFMLGELESIGSGRWRLRMALKPKPGIGEKILGCEFVPWHEAMLVGDLLTMSAIGRLLAAEHSRI